MTKMENFGLPLDSRGNYCKSDWQMWAMGFADLESQRTKLINTLWRYINETSSRVPVSDNHDVKSGNQAMFQARSVVGGYWMRAFVEQFDINNPTGINCPQVVTGKSSNGKWFDLQGRQWQAPQKGIHIKDGKKVVIK